jgi:putative flippase GtrA
MQAAPRQAVSGTFFRFLLVGGSATALQYILFFAFVTWLAVAPVAGSSLAYAIITLYSYVASHGLTFRSRRRHGSAMPRFLLVLGVGLGRSTLVDLFPRRRAAAGHRHSW